MRSATSLLNPHYQIANHIWMKARLRRKALYGKRRRISAGDSATPARCNSSGFEADHFRLAHLGFPLMMGRALGNTPRPGPIWLVAHPAVAPLVRVPKALGVQHVLG